MAYGYRAPVRSIGRRVASRFTQKPQIGGNLVESALALAQVRQEMIDNEAKRHEEHMKNEAVRQAAHEAKMRELDGVISTGRQKINNLRVPAKGDPGKAADEYAIEERVLARIPAPKAGESVEPDDVARIVMDMLSAEKEDPIAPGDIVAQVIKEITDKKILKPDHIDGLSKDLKQFASQLKPGIGYVHGGGITRLTAGTNITITKLSDGSYRITAASSGLTTLTATETPNGVRTIFTFAAATAQPAYILVDNVWQRATTAKGTANWTWNSGSLKATFAVPPTDEVLGIV